MAPFALPGGLSVCTSVLQVRRGHVAAMGCYSNQAAYVAMNCEKVTKVKINRFAPERFHESKHACKLLPKRRGAANRRQIACISGRLHAYPAFSNRLLAVSACRCSLPLALRVVFPTCHLPPLDAICRLPPQDAACRLPSRMPCVVSV